MRCLLAIGLLGLSSLACAQYPDEGRDSVQFANQVEAVEVKVYYSAMVPKVIEVNGRQVEELDTLFGERHYALILSNKGYQYFQHYYRNNQIEFVSTPIFSNDTLFKRKRIANGEFDYEEHILSAQNVSDSALVAQNFSAILTTNQAIDTYDDSGRLVKRTQRNVAGGYIQHGCIIEPAMISWTYEYNVAGQLVSKKSFDTRGAPDGRWEYEYNERGLVTRISYFSNGFHGHQSYREHHVFDYAYNLNL